MRLAPLAAALALPLATLAHDGEGNDPPGAPFPDIHGKVIGHGDHHYTVNARWARVTPDVAPVINSHAMVEGNDGLLYLVTDHPENAFLVFKKDGTFVRSFGKGLYGGHGIDVITLDGEEHLIHVDCGWHFAAEGWNAKPGNGSVSIVKKDGTIVRTLPTPIDLGMVEAGDKKFMPCDIAVTPSNTILIVDGYASDFVYEMNADGEFLKRWGGPADGSPGHLSNAHGISIEPREDQDPLVWVSSRNQTKIKAFTLDGDHVETIDLPGAYAGQLFIKGDKMYTAVCWSKEDGSGKRLGQSGFVLVLDRATRKVISAPGGSAPTYADGVLKPLTQATKTFLHGHDLCVDDAGNIYVGEWNANRRYPFRLEPTDN